MGVVSIIVVIIASFFLGFFVQEKICRVRNLDDKCRATLKKHKDIVNWLKSDLAHIKKLGKRNIDHNKVKLLELLIKRLEK